MTTFARCAVPGCLHLAVDHAPLCRPHLLRVPVAPCDALLAAWQVYELSQQTSDADEYTRQLREVLRELALITHPHRPVQLRLVK